MAAVTAEGHARAAFRESENWSGRATDLEDTAAAESWAVGE